VCPRKKNGPWGYVQELSLFPFKMLLFVDDSLCILHKLTHKDDQLVLIMDATQNLMSGLPKPLDTTRPFLYTILAASGNKDADFPICEFVSVRHTHADINAFMLTYFEL